MSENAGLTDEQKEINRLKWLLIEGCVRDIMQENQMLLVWMSDYEKRLNEP